MARTTRGATTAAARLLLKSLPSAPLLSLLLALPTALAAGLSEPVTTGDTLFTALKSNDTGLFGLLLDQGAAIDARDERQRTPLHLAAGLFGGGEALMRLLAAGAAVEARDVIGGTPLHLAAAIGNFPAVQPLVEAGAPLEAADVKQNTPLHVAAANGHVGAIRALLAAGADVEARDDFKATPLMLAAMHGWTPALKELLEGNASVFAVVASNHNAAHAAAERQHYDAAKLLNEWSQKEDKELDAWTKAGGLGAAHVKILRKINVQNPDPNP